MGKFIKWCREKLGLCNHEWQTAYADDWMINHYCPKCGAFRQEFNPHI